jgi:hypothetical protein
MMIGIGALLLAVLTALLIWRTAQRAWHVFFIVVLAALLFPAVATWLTGDVSRYLPAGTFAQGVEGEGQIVLASAAATILLALILAACLWGSATAAWRRVRKV